MPDDRIQISEFLPGLADGKPEEERCQTPFLISDSDLCLLTSRKEVIQPQVPLRLPCYDFTPVADLTVVG